MAVYKVSCEFFVKAENEEDVENYLNEEAGLDFSESHLIINQMDKGEVKEKDIYEEV